jgi:hypothetical protein
LGNNIQFTAGKSIPWLQDVDGNADGSSDMWAAWGVGHLEMLVLDGTNEPVSKTNLIQVSLNEPANYAAVRQSLIDTAMESQKPWQNHDNPLDVDGNGLVIPLDALIIVNRINTVGIQKLPPPTANQSPPSYYDTDGDGESAPLDALLVINYLNSPSNAASGEGESASVQRQLPTEDPIAVDGLADRISPVGSASHRDLETLTAVPCRTVHESLSARSPSDVAWETQTDRVFATHHADWLSFGVGPLAADSGSDRPDSSDLRHSLHDRGPWNWLEIAGIP